MIKIAIALLKNIGKNSCIGTNVLSSQNANQNKNAEITKGISPIVNSKIMPLDVRFRRKMQMLDNIKIKHIILNISLSLPMESSDQKYWLYIVLLNIKYKNNIPTSCQRLAL